MVGQSFSSSKIIVNGREFGSLDDLPPELKQKLDKDNDGQLDFLQNHPDIQQRLATGKAPTGRQILELLVPTMKFAFSLDKKALDSVAVEAKRFADQTKQASTSSTPGTFQSTQNQSYVSPAMPSSPTKLSKPTHPSSSPIIVEPHSNVWQKWLIGILVVLVGVQLAFPGWLDTLWQEIWLSLAL